MSADEDFKREWATKKPRSLFPRKSAKPKGRRENAVQAGIISYLDTRKDILWFRKNVGAANYGGYYVKFGKDGEADIQGVQAPRGQAFAIEIKREIGGELSDAQKIWRDNWIAFGGIFLEGRSIEEVQQFLGPELARIVKIPDRKRVYPR